MATSIYDIGYFPKNYLNYLAQRRIGTGTPIRPEDVQAIAEAEINARYADASKRRALDINETSVNNAYDLGIAKLNAEGNIYDSMMGQQKQAGLLGAGVNLLTSVPSGYMLGKEMGWWGGKTTPTVEPTKTVAQSTSTTPSPLTNTATGTAGAMPGIFANRGIAVTDGLPDPGAAMYAPGEFATGFIGGTGDVMAEAASGGYLAPPAGNIPSTTGAESIWGGYAPFIGGGIRTAVGLATGEEPVSAFSHGAGAGAGALGGAAIGSAFGPVGTIIGGILGAIGGDAAVGWIEDACIIVTACNGKGSPEVDIARKFRDGFMTPEQIRGYYAMAEVVAPVLHRSESMKQAVKVALVDKLIDYGKFKLGMADSCPEESEKIALSFLNDCEKVGKTMPSYTRITGEVV